MRTYTPLQTLNQVHRQLWWLIRLLGAAQVQLNDNSPTRLDTQEVEKVLRAMTSELARIIRKLEPEVTKQRNYRPGEELALKAQLAKARQAVASALKVVPDDQSHK